MGETAPVSLSTLMKLVKIEHTLFALPLAITGAVLAARGLPDWRVVALVCAAFTAARTTAMAFNRWADRHMDALNPRTASREIPSGRISARAVLVLAFVSAAAFLAFAFALNPLCFRLSPFALAVLLGYSYTKRFTSWCHFVLGLALGMAPVAGWVAVAGAFDPAPVILGCAVLMWVAGFDILYACQDVDFDRRTGLYSVPAALGTVGALRLAALCHAVSFALMLWTGILANLGWLFFLASLATGGLLILEHRLVRPQDLRRLKTAFFHVNSMVSLSLLTSVALGLM